MSRIQLGSSTGSNRGRIDRTARGQTAPPGHQLAAALGQPEQGLGNHVVRFAAQRRCHDAGHFWTDEPRQRPEVLAEDPVDVPHAETVNCAGVHVLVECSQHSPEPVEKVVTARVFPRLQCEEFRRECHPPSLGRVAEPPRHVGPAY